MNINFHLEVLGWTSGFVLGSKSVPQTFIIPRTVASVVMFRSWQVAKIQESKLNHANTLWSLLISHLNILFAKVSNIAKTNISEMRKYPSTLIGRNG